MSEEKISEPIGIQSAEVLEWSKSLRDRSPSPVRNKTRSRSPSPGRSSARRHTPTRKECFSGTIPSAPGVIMSDFPKPRSSRAPKVSQSLKTSTLRKSSRSPVRNSTGTLTSSLAEVKTKKLSSSAEGQAIEAEYIKNLQQQIYFLELETNYLREQAKKATEMHPKMSAEAERMLAKLRTMQSDMDGLCVENERKSSSIGIIRAEKDHLAEKLRDEEDARVRDKRMLMEEIIELKKTIAKTEAEVTYKDGQLFDARNELDKSATALKNAETKIISYKTQLEQRVEQHNMTQISLDEKRSELLSVETQLRSLEEKYYNSTVNLQDKVTNDLREEIRELRQRLKEAEMTAEQERHLRTKMSDDGSNIVRENATFHQQVVELTKQLERERNLRDEMESRHSNSISEMVAAKEKEKERQFEMEYVKEQLRKELEKSRQFQESLMSKESLTTQQVLQLNTAKSRVTELSSMHENVEKENGQLRKDKALLVDHVADIQKKLECKGEEMVHLKSKVLSLEQRLEELDQINSLENTSQTQKWSEFERLAESMRTLSHTMASSRTQSPRTATLTGSLGGTSRPLQY